MTDQWELIVEGRVLGYELISLPTPDGNVMWCSAMTIRVDRNMTGGASPQIRAITTGIPQGQRPPGPGVTANRSDGVALPPVEADGVFFLNRAGRQEGWARNPSAIVFNSTKGAFVAKRDEVEIHAPWGARWYAYDRLVSELEEAVQARTVEALVKRASFIARIRVGPIAQRQVSRDSVLSIRYPVEVLEVYRGEHGFRPATVLFGGDNLMRPSARDYFQLHEGRNALIFGEMATPADVRLLPAGFMGMVGESVETGIVESSGDSAVPLYKPLKELEPAFR